MNEKARLDKVAQILQGGISQMRWRFGSSPPPRRGEKVPVPKQVIVVEPVFQLPAKVVAHYGIGITRWEVWLPATWLERVYERGIWLFPEQEEIVLDAWDYEKPPGGVDACFKVHAMGDVPRDLTKYHDWERADRVTVGERYVVVWAKAGGIGQTPIEAASRAMLIWEEAIGVDRSSELPF